MIPFPSWSDAMIWMAENKAGHCSFLIAVRSEYTPVRMGEVFAAISGRLPSRPPIKKELLARFTTGMGCVGVVNR